MKTAYSTFLVGLLLISLPGCWSSKPEKRTGLVIVNVLDAALYEDCRIKGSINIPFEMIETAADLIDKSAQVVIYCSNYRCTSSEYAARKLKKMGFADVAVYEGGMAEWYQRGLPVQGSQMQPYLKKSCPQFSLENSSDIPIISVDELAHKMGITK